MTVEGSRRWWLLALGACLVADLLLLGDALFSDAVRAPYDLQQRQAAFRAPGDGPSRVQNPLLSDWAVQFEPWSRLVRESWGEGRVPWWNELSGRGTPLAANLQCEALSPYLPLSLLAGEQWWDLKQLAVLLIAQGLALLLARALGLRPAPGLVVALGWSFCCYLQGWCMHPHAGSAAFAPGILLGFLLLRRRVTPRRIAGTACVLALSVLAGHVESAFKAGLLGSLVALLYLPDGRRSLLRTPRWLGASAIATVVGLCLASVVLLPFLEYLTESNVVLVRRLLATSGARVPPSPLHLFTALDPDALGPWHPGEGAWRGARNVLENGVFCGRALLALGAAGALLGLATRPRVTLPLLAVSGLGLCAAYGAPGLRDLLVSVPPFDSTPLRRLTFLAFLPLALLAGMAIDGAWPRSVAPRRAVAQVLWLTPLTLVAGAWILLAVAGLGERGPRPALGLTSALLLVGTGLVASLGAGARFEARTRRAFLLLAVLAVGGEGVLSWRSWVPTTPAAERPAVRAPARAAARALEGELALPLGWAWPAEAHSLAGVRSLSCYDAIGLARHSEMLAAAGGFARIDHGQRSAGSEPRLLDAMGVRWTLSLWPPGEACRSRVPASVTPARSYVRACGAARGPVRLLVSAAGGTLAASGARVRLRGAAGRSVLADLPLKDGISLGGIRLSRSGSRAARDFATLNRTGLQGAVLEIRGSADEGSPVTLEISARDGSLVVDELVDGIGREDLVEGPVRGRWHVAERGSALPAAYLAARLQRLPEHATLLTALRAAAFDAHRVTLLEGEGPELSAGGRVLGFHRSTPQTLQVDLKAAGPALLVVQESFARGWQATLEDGTRLDLEPANLGNLGIWVPAGQHRVLLDYEPACLPVAVALAALALLICVAAWLRRP